MITIKELNETNVFFNDLVNKLYLFYQELSVDIYLFYEWYELVIRMKGYYYNNWIYSEITNKQEVFEGRFPHRFKLGTRVLKKFPWNWLSLTYFVQKGLITVK